MTRNRRLGLLLSALFMALVTHHPCLADHPTSSPSKSLPSFFKPLSWDTDSKKLKILFPHCKIQAQKMPVVLKGQHSEEMTVFAIQGVKRDHLGKALGEVFVDRDGKIQRITFATPLTSKESKSHYQKLVQAYEKFEKSLAKQYGPPQEDTIKPDDPQKYPPKSSQWLEPGFNLVLFVLADEKGHWALNILVQKN